jgi:hypothetical protein
MHTEQKLPPEAEAIYAEVPAVLGRLENLAGEEQARGTHPVAFMLGLLHSAAAFATSNGMALPDFVTAAKLSYARMADIDRRNNAAQEKR